MIDFCAEMKLYVCSTYLKRKHICKYTRAPNGRTTMVVMNMVDLMLVKKYAKYECDEKTAKKLRQRISSHYLVPCKVKMVSTRIKKSKEGGMGLE